MVKISFQPAVAGIKGDKADKASASASAPAPAPAAEILLTPARVRGTGGLRQGTGGRSAPCRPRRLPEAHRDPGVSSGAGVGFRNGSSIPEWGGALGPGPLRQPKAKSEEREGLRVDGPR